MATEKRLIDANAFRKSCEGWKAGKIPKNELLWDLDHQPTVDAVEVVRCKDCARSRKWGSKETLLCYRDETTIHIVNPDAYCDGSQRKYAADNEESVEVVHSQWDTVFYERNGTLASYSHLCPVCKYFYRDVRFKGHNFCPNCGVKMDGGKDDELKV